MNNLGRLHYLQTVPLHQYKRMLDGQWQGTILASDGNMYFGAGSHSTDTGALFFRYNLRDDRLTVLSDNISAVCGEAGLDVPPQGKIHSEIVEHDGWLYFGTHTGDYSELGRAKYTGGHLIGYELGTGAFRDFGVVHPNYTNYSGLALDAGRGRIYYYVTPTRQGPGSYLYAIDVPGGIKRNLGLVRAYNDAGNGMGPSVQYFQVDGRGDCWFPEPNCEDGNLMVVRGATGQIETWPGVIPPKTAMWEPFLPLGPYRTVVYFRKHLGRDSGRGLWVMDTEAEGKPPTFEFLHELNGYVHHGHCYDDRRLYWVEFRRLPEGGIESRLCSLARPGLNELTVHGELTDAEGRRVHSIGGMVSDGQGKLLIVGRWFALDEERETRGVNRRGQWVTLLFRSVAV